MLRNLRFSEILSFCGKLVTKFLNFSSQRLKSSTQFNKDEKYFAYAVGKRWQIVCREKCIQHFCLQNNRAIARGN